MPQAVAAHEVPDVIRLSLQMIAIFPLRARVDRRFTGSPHASRVVTRRHASGARRVLGRSLARHLRQARAQSRGSNQNGSSERQTL